MPPHQHQLSLLGRLLVNIVLAAIIFAATSLFPPSGLTLALALAGLAIGSAIAAGISVTPSASSDVGGNKHKTGGKQQTGSIKWFNATKGFGFIVGDDGAEVFVHYRNVEGVSKRNIKQGQKVSYVVRQSDRGPQAEDVQPL